MVEIETAEIGDGPEIPSGADDYWNSLVHEMAAAEFLGLSRRTIQDYRQRGGGPRYIAISRRCIRYRRIDLRDWVEGKLRNSTSDNGEGKTT